MPMPTPNTGESQDAFISRCMGSEIMQSDYPDGDQRLAVCHQQWDDKNKKSAPRSETRRYCETEFRVLDAEGEKPARIGGYAVLYDVLSPPLHTPVGVYRERIRPGAFTQSLDNGPDIVAKLEHQGGLTTLGRRSAGTLRVWEDSRGVQYEVDLPDTQAGRDVLTLIGRRDIKGSSFAFGEVRDQVLVENDEPVREVLQALMYDVSPTSDPAYDKTTAEPRSVSRWYETHRPTPRRNIATAKLRLCQGFSAGWLRRNPEQGLTNAD